MYISATQALVRTQNARKSDSYVGEYEVYPAMMAHIMDLITEATLAGRGSVTYHVDPYRFHEYTKKAVSIGRELMEEKMTALGYRIVEVDENLYNFIWLND